MKPLGTITKYYPFIDEESKSILDSIMDDSSSYNDFVQKLGEVVLENEVPANLAYVAAVQAWWCRFEETMNRIQEKYNEVLWIRPWGYYHGSMERDQILQHDELVGSIDKAIDCSHEDWIETELHLLHTFFHHPLGDVISVLEPLEKAKVLIDTHPQLRCFESLIYAFESLTKAREGDMKGCLSVLRKGRELAEDYDDTLYKYMNMLSEGNVLKAIDVQSATSVFEDLYDLVQDLDVPYYLCEVLNDYAIVFEAKGEFDLAISSHFEVLKIMGDLRQFDTSWILLARNYATLGDGHQALEWINRGLESCGPLDTPTMYSVKAWALALLDRIEEAEETLEIAHSLTIKSGLEVHLQNHYHFSGVVDLKKGNLLDALGLFEKAWEIAGRSLNVTAKNLVLLDLTRVEILIDNQSINRTKFVVPGKWLSKLETHAMERDLPGFRMYAALLKSEFYQNHGQLQDAIATLEDALGFTDSLGVETLRKRITERITKLNRVLKDA
ncbi:MAG: tetratricopeptide repeat protein [Candidatus Thorarchaeota archaeon]